MQEHDFLGVIKQYWEQDPQVERGVDEATDVTSLSIPRHCLLFDLEFSVALRYTVATEAERFKERTFYTAPRFLVQRLNVTKLSIVYLLHVLTSSDLFSSLGLCTPFFALILKDGESLQKASLEHAFWIPASQGIRDQAQPVNETAEVSKHLEKGVVMSFIFVSYIAKS